MATITDEAILRVLRRGLESRRMSRRVQGGVHFDLAPDAGERHAPADGHRRPRKEEHDANGFRSTSRRGDR